MSFDVDAELLAMDPPSDPEWRRRIVETVEAHEAPERDDPGPD